jgi:hypothetical protein
VRARLADERRVAETLPFLEHLHDLTVALEPDRALADDEQVAVRGPAAQQDARVLRVVGDLQARLELAKHAAGKAIERRVRPEELDRFHA